MRRLFLLLAAGALCGCSSVISSGATTTAQLKGDFWYVRASAVSSHVFYCPPHASIGSARCVEAEMIDEPTSGTMGPTSEPSAAPPAAAAAQPAAPPSASASPAPASASPATAPPPASASPSTPGACTTDADCKRGRTCRDGVCQSG
jgi:hypothetical protein